MRTRVLVAGVALVGLLAGCAGGAPIQPSPAATPVEQPSAAASDPGSPAPAPSSPAPSASDASPGSTGREVTAADGALTWTMPCTPEQEDIEGNEEDEKTYRSYRGWRCGKRGAATSGAFVVELIEQPRDAGTARRVMRTALKQLAPNSSPKDNEVAGQPGISDTSELGGKEFGLQAISFGSYLALFIATPADDLRPIVDSVQVG